MRNGIVYFFVGLLFLTGAGCAKQPLTANNAVTGAETDKSAGTEQSVQLPEGAHADSDGFVYFPGEASRPDKSYYITSDVCGQFTQKFIEGLVGKKIYKTEEIDKDPQYNCRYFFSEGEKSSADYLQIALVYLNVDDQKKGHEFLGRTIGTDPGIGMNHYVVKQEDGLINEINLVLGAQKFISINRGSVQVLTEQEDLGFAAKLADKIKNSKKGNTVTMILCRKSSSIFFHRDISGS